MINESVDENDECENMNFYLCLTLKRLLAKSLGNVSLFFVAK